MRNEHSFLSTTVLRILFAATGALLLVGLLATSFVGSGVKTAPRDVPVAVIGGAAAAHAVAVLLDQRAPGGFDVVPTADQGAARELVLDRAVYGALVTEGPKVAQVMITTSASPAVAQILTQLARRVGAASVTDLAPTPAADPRGAGLAGGALPITISGILAGMILAFLVGSRRGQVLGSLVLGGLFGAVLLGVIRGAYSALDGSAVAEWAAVSAGVATIAIVLVGFYRLAGRIGLIAAELTLIILGNPWSAATSAPELLPEPWSTLGHRMPLGATVDIVRGVTGFNGAAISGSVLALSAWATLGLAMVAASHYNTRVQNAPAEPGATPPVPDPPLDLV